MVAQVAFALAVLIVAGPIVRTVMAIERVPLGMNDWVARDACASIRRRTTTTGRGSGWSSLFSIGWRRCQEGRRPPRRPGLPVVDAEPLRQFAVAGRPAPSPGRGAVAAEAAVFGDYARAIALLLLEGRMRQAGDCASTWAVALVSREAARRDRRH